MMSFRVKWCKFTPLGFETTQKDEGGIGGIACKFTPLGFETLFTVDADLLECCCVNLPRWGLKRP